MRNYDRRLVNNIESVNPSQLLERFPAGVASVIPETDAEVSRGRYRDGVGGFEEPRQIELIAERLDTADTDYDAIETEVPYLSADRWCDIVLDTPTSRLTIEAKLLRFNRSNGVSNPQRMARCSVRCRTRS